MQPHDDVTDPRLGKALAHPLRIRILKILERRIASPSEIARELGVPLGNVAYHMRTLASLGFAHCVRKTPRRGVLEHHYRADALPNLSDEAWAHVPAIVKEAMLRDTLNDVSTHVNAAAATGGFNRSDAHLSRTELALDDQGAAEPGQEVGPLAARAE